MQQVTHNTINPVQVGESNEPELIKSLYSKVLAIINQVKTISGLDEKELKNLQPTLAEYWNKIVENGVLESNESDAKIRPYFVTLQGIVEHVLARELGKSISSLVLNIHTPAPATPVCDEGNISEGLVDKQIAEDAARLSTVTFRAHTIRYCLEQKATLNVLYPSDGVSKRTPEQLKIFKELKDHYQLTLHDMPMSCESVPNELIGATHAFSDNEGKEYVFGIKMTQANSPTDSQSAVWFGERSNKSISDRILAVSEFLQMHNDEFKI